MSHAYVSRFADGIAGLVCEPLKLKLKQGHFHAKVPPLPHHRCVGIHNASQKPCFLLLKHDVGEPEQVHLAPNKSYFFVNDMDDFEFESFAWCYALYADTKLPNVLTNLSLSAPSTRAC